jgi:7-cyano-7-deazaguanine reductase
MTPEPLPAFTYLGRSTPAPTTPDEAVLDRMPHAHSTSLCSVRFSAPEFTVLCAVTGQPDFAHLVIDYVPRKWVLESKSLKFYLASFRTHSGFHEQITITIGKRIAEGLEPVYLRIGAYWYPRGGIPIDVFWQTGTPPAEVWLPDQGVATYRARG